VKRSKKKHRWALVGKTWSISARIKDSGATSLDSKPVRFKWSCRRCGLEKDTPHEHPPSGMLQDQEGRRCSVRVVDEVMSL